MRVAYVLNGTPARDIRTGGMVVNVSVTVLGSVISTLQVVPSGETDVQLVQLIEESASGAAISVTVDPLLKFLGAQEAPHAISLPVSVPCPVPLIVKVSVYGTVIAMSRGVEVPIFPAASFAKAYSFLASAANVNRLRDHLDSLDGNFALSDLQCTPYD